MRGHAVVGAILAAACCGALAAGAEGAGLPEVGQCAKGESKVFVYKDKGCTKLSKGENTGSYEFGPLPAEDTGFTVAGTLTFNSASREIRCSTDPSSGEFTGPQSMSVVLHFGCGQVVAGSGQACRTKAGAPEGPVETVPLQAHLGYIDRSAAPPVVGWQLEPVAGTQLIEMECRGATLTIDGSVVFEMKKGNPRGEHKVVFGAMGMKQVPEALEGGQPAALSMTYAGETEAIVVTSKRYVIESTAGPFVIKG